jgi:hypothetical protein
MLRTDLFKTVDRAETRFIAVRDTLTQADPDIDILEMDIRHCRQGRLGVGYHFLLTVSGDIQLGRDVNTIGSHSRKFDTNSVAIGVVGGLDEERSDAFTRTREQQDALLDLTAFLQEFYPTAEVHDQRAENILPPH